MGKKGISAKIATVVMIIITIILFGLAYVYILSLPPETPYLPCEYICVLKGLNYDRYNELTRECICKECKSYELEGKFTACQLTKWIIKT